MALEGGQCSLSDEVTGESNSGDERVISGPGSDGMGSGPVGDERVGCTPEAVEPGVRTLTWITQSPFTVLPRVESTDNGRTGTTDQSVASVSGPVTETGASTDVAGNTENQSDHCDTDTHTETREEFQLFAEEYGFEHTTSSPLYQKANGNAEKGVEIVKRLLKKAAETKSDPYLALLTYRSSPLGSGASPSELLMNRKLRRKSIMTRRPGVSHLSQNTTWSESKSPTHGTEKQWCSKRSVRGRTQSERRMDMYFGGTADACSGLKGQCQTLLTHTRLSSPQSIRHQNQRRGHLSAVSLAELEDQE